MCDKSRLGGGVAVHSLPPNDDHIVVANDESLAASENGHDAP